MARARNIKPGFFTNDELAELDPLARILFAGLWTIADRAGRLEDRIKKIKAAVLPYDECDCDKLLQDLDDHGFILRYSIGEKCFIQVVKWDEHQNPHVKEAESTIQAPDKNSTRTGKTCKAEQPKPERTGLIPLTLNPIRTKEDDPSDSVESAQNPKVLIFTQGVEILRRHGTTESAARSFLGKYAGVDETKLAGVIGQLMAQPKIEPRAYIVAAMTPKKRELVL